MDTQVQLIGRPDYGSAAGGAEEGRGVRNSRQQHVTALRAVRPTRGPEQRNRDRAGVLRSRPAAFEMGIPTAATAGLVLYIPRGVVLGLFRQRGAAVRGEGEGAQCGRKTG